MRSLRFAAAVVVTLAACTTHDHVDPVTDVPLGGSCMASTECSTEFCRWPEGHTCGDGTDGTCVAKIINFDCSDLVAYVCGCDGKTYNNACFATAAGESVAYTGMCH